ncbi:MAG: diacylglycerol kinase family protein [Thermodesulfobacteriota bacterium]
MSNPQTAFIINPRAGGGSGKYQWPRISILAEKIFGRTPLYFTRCHGDAQNQALQAISEGADRIIVVGGDGTINEVANAIMTFDPPVRNRLVMGVIPIGTGCDFIKSVPISHHPETALQSIQEGSVHRIDVGRASFFDHHRRSVSRHFLNIISFGIGGEVSRMASRMSAHLSPLFSFLFATFISVYRYGKKQIQIQIDESPKMSYQVWNVAISNGRFHGGGMMVAPTARLDDGLLQITLIGDLSLMEVFLNLSKLYNGRIHSVKKVVSATGKRIESDSPDRVLLEIDGEPLGGLPIQVEIIPGAIHLIAPAGTPFFRTGDRI